MKNIEIDLNSIEISIEIKKGKANMAEQIETGIEKEQEPGCCHQKQTPRDPERQRKLQNRLNRMIGQLNGIKRMLEDNRYCGEVLTQIAAVESALENLGYEVLQEHMDTCVVEEIQKGNTAIMGEAVELMKKLK